MHKRTRLECWNLFYTRTAPSVPPLALNALYRHISGSFRDGLMAMVCSDRRIVFLFECEPAFVLRFVCLMRLRGCVGNAEHYCQFWSQTPFISFPIVVILFSDYLSYNESKQSVAIDS